MTHWIGYAVGIEAFVIILLIYGLTVFFIATRRLSHEIRLSFFIILGSLAFQVIQGGTVAVLLINKVAHDHPLWMMFPLFSLVGAYLLALGAKRFLAEV